VTVVRVLLAVIWLALGLTTTAHAMPKADCAMLGMTHHHSRPDDSIPTDMPCCSQPAIISTPAPVVFTERTVLYVRLTPAPVTKLTGTPIRTEPRPPKAI